MSGPENNPRDDEPIDRKEYEKWEAQQKGEKMPTFEGQQDYRARLIEVAQALGYDASIVDNESCNALAHSVKTLAENFARLVFAAPPALEKLQGLVEDYVQEHREMQCDADPCEKCLRARAVLAELSPPPRTCVREQLNQMFGKDKVDYAIDEAKQEPE